jgi:hypothetical protein
MSFSYTVQETITFSVTHARHMAAKVATDLKRIQRFYGEPNDAWIALLEAEIIEFLKDGYLGTVTYGYWRNGKWIDPTLRYTAKDLAGQAANDDDPGNVRPGRNINGASFYTFLTYSAAWDAATDSEKAAFRSGLPFLREGAPEPGIDGYLSADRIYSAGGRALNRASVKGY